MASETRRRLRAACLASLALAAAAGSLDALAADNARVTIFQCELNGKKVTSDRLIPECNNKEQRQLNPDGSLNKVIPPPPTADESAAIAETKAREDAERVARNDAVRRDRNLMQRFPSEAVHRLARAKALDDLRSAAKNSEARIALLMAERKKLEDERQFYVNDHVNKPLPSHLRQKLDANDAALEAQKSLAQNQDSEVVRINRLYDLELARLQKLWNGAQPGSLGPVPGPQANIAPAAAPVPAPVGMKTSSK
jgi:hypothetical protein